MLFLNDIFFYNDKMYLVFIELYFKIKFIYSLLYSVTRLKWKHPYKNLTLILK